MFDDSLTKIVIKIKYVHLIRKGCIFGVKKQKIMKDLEFLCLEVQQIARRAGMFLREERQRFDRSRVEEKSAHNYVSYVDKESERRIIEQLSELLPEAGVLAEEGSGRQANETYCWVIDPLDGTTNYIHDLAPYCVSIALRNRENIVLGVVYEVCRNECFHAIRGGAAYRDGKEIHVSEVDTLDQACIALGFPYNSDAYRPTALRLVDRLYGFAGGTRLLGSAAAELCYVAAGRFDARVEAYLGPWDVAAGGLILQQAGGRITDFQGEAGWMTGLEVAASNGKLHDQVLKKLIP